MPRKKSSRGRRRGRRRGGLEEGVASSVSETKDEAKQTQTKRKRTSRKRRTINIDAWIDRHIDEVVSLTGLDLLGLTREQYLELLKDIIIQLYGSLSSYTKASVLAKRFMRYRDRVYPVIAARLASMLDKFNDTQLEFIVFNIGDEVLGLAPKLYEYLRKVGRDDLISMLRSKWATAWINRRSKVLPVECPKCGFNSLMPDLTCLVCSSSVSEKELKERIKFKELLKEFSNLASCDELKEVLKRGYVRVNNVGIVPPSFPRSRVDIEVYLSGNEINIVKSAYESKCKGGN